MRFQRPVLWIHSEALGPANPALLSHPGRPAVFVFDRELIGGGADGPPLSLKRLAFLYECLLELPVTIRAGEVAAEVIGFAARLEADGVVTSRAVDPRFERIRRRIEASLPVQTLEPEPFVAIEEPVDLRRFGRYWRRAEPALWDRFGTTDSHDHR